MDIFLGLICLGGVLMLAMAFFRGSLKEAFCMISDLVDDGKIKKKGGDENMLFSDWDCEIAADHWLTYEELIKAKEEDQPEKEEDMEGHLCWLWKIK